MKKLGVIVVNILAWVIALVFGAACFIGVLYVFAASVENIGKRNLEHDRCMKHATNGYEIEQCR